MKKFSGFIILQKQKRSYQHQLIAPRIILQLNILLKQVIQTQLESFIRIKLTYMPVFVYRIIN